MGWKSWKGGIIGGLIISILYFINFIFYCPASFNDSFLSKTIIAILDIFYSAGSSDYLNAEKICKIRVLIPLVLEGVVLGLLIQLLIGIKKISPLFKKYGIKIIVINLFKP